MSGPQIGVPAVRVGGYERVTGQQRYVGDLRLDHVLHVKLVTLDCARARIDGVDASTALQVPGVHAVVSAADLPQPVPRFGPVYQDRPVLAVGETKYHGEAVAAVVAETEQAAAEAAALVRVAHQELPAVLTVADALDPAAPLVQDPALRTGELAGTNTLREWNLGWGDVAAAHAAHVVEHSYTFPMVTHFAIEPLVFLAAPAQGGVTVWSAIQHPYLLQQTLARVLDLPLAKVHVVAPDPGGAFGGKQHAKYEPLLALLARRLGRPVRLALSLAETFQTMRRSSWEVVIRSGFATDGSIVFQDVDVRGLLGAYADIGVRVIAKATYLMCGPYRTPNARVRVRALLSHTVPATAFRGFGTPQVAWALESQLDQAARELGLDRLAIRLRNLVGPGEDVVPGDKPADGDWQQSLRTAAERIGWGDPLPSHRGRGIAVAIKSSATTGASYAVVRLHDDGSATVLAGTSDMGQGARTVLAQVAAEELGTTVDRVQVVLGDTAVAPYDMQTSASRSTVFMGTAVARACRDVRAKLHAMAADAYDLDLAEVQVGPGLVRLPDRELSFPELMAEAFGGVRGEVIGVGERRGESDARHPLGGRPAFYEFNATAVEVEVDPETGELLVVKHVSVADVGRALNPAHVAAQDEGAAIMGLGHTLMEHLLLDGHGRIRNLGALDYRVPTTKDVPLELHTYLVENEDGPGPYGAKGVGEGGLFAIAPAVAAAVTDATGVVIRELPLTAERVWQAITTATGQARPRPPTPEP